MQIDQLCSSMEPIDWPMLYAWICGRGSIPEQSFLLTFDDGLADHARMVLPILERRNLRAVFFVTGAELMMQKMLPAHAIHMLLALLGNSVFEDELKSTLRAHGIGSTTLTSLVDTEAAETLYDYESPTRARLKYLLTSALPTDVRNAAIDRMFEQHVGSSARWSKAWYLGWDDLVEMSALGHTVGAHGYTHEPLTRLALHERRQDLQRIAAVLRSGLGSDIRPVSYPYGQWDEDTCRACSEAGFAHAFTTQPHWITKASDALALPRVDTIKVDALLKEQVQCQQA
jgi:peptidoglycan/xylan/chitin deacetylase (PgdA/CDA1 family)